MSTKRLLQELERLTRLAEEAATNVTLIKAELERRKETPDA